jgi:response regulator RpfG family c-di-GMP phosphodiesterase
MSEKILLVDDDPNLLASCERNFRRQFQLDTAEGGESGLAKISQRGPYAVVVSDRQMPGLDGVQFLSEVRRCAPDTVRIMLTGNADLESTVQVVNEGNIFRFLTKPCPPEHLARVLQDALAQYRLVMAEKELLNKTLSGSIKLLTDILSIVDSQSFGRAQSMRDLILSVADKLNLDNAWEMHVAVMLSPIGYVTIPPETLIKARAGQVLSKIEEQMVRQVPDIAARLLANIPRLEGVARIVRYQFKHYDGTGSPQDSVAGTAIPHGARMLKVLVDLKQLQAGGLSRIQALDEMEARLGWYDPALLAAVRSHFGIASRTESPRPSISISVKDLAPGMVLQSRVETREGTLILLPGHCITEITLEKIQNFDLVSGIKEPIFVVAPEPTGLPSQAQN